MAVQWNPLQLLPLCARICALRRARFHVRRCPTAMHRAGVHEMCSTCSDDMMYDARGMQQRRDAPDAWSNTESDTV